MGKVLKPVQLDLIISQISSCTYMASFTLKNPEHSPHHSYLNRLSLPPMQSPTGGMLQLLKKRAATLNISATGTEKEEGSQLCLQKM